MHSYTIQLVKNYLRVKTRWKELKQFCWTTLLHKTIFYEILIIPSHLWTHGNWHSICQDIYTFEHLCPDICTKTNILGHKPPLNKIGTRLDESGKSVHLAGLESMFLFRLEVLFYVRYFQLLSNLTWNKQAVWRPNVLKWFCK